MKRLLTAAALLAAAPSAAQIVTGNDLVEACSATSGETQGFCIGFILGATEGIRYGIGWPMLFGENSVEEINSRSDQLLMYCSDQGVINSQNVAVVAKYLKDNPQKLHYPARGLILEAYQAAYPCP